MNRAIDFPDICNKLRPILGNRVDELFLEYSLADTPEKKQEIYSLVLALYSRYVDRSMLQGEVILDSPPQGRVAGEYPLGIVKYPHRKDQVFGLRENDWARHVCITGMSGSGKTTLAVKILDNFLKKKRNFLVFDWKKSFRRLLYLSKDVLVFTVGKPNATNFFRLNINRPPVGVGPDEWINVLCDLLCEVYGASYGVHKLLTSTLKKAFTDFGVYAGSGNYPTWYQIRDRLDELAEKSQRKGRESEWLTSAQRIAYSLTFGEFGRTVNDKSAVMQTEELLCTQSVFELDALGTMEKKMFCSFILLYLYKFKKANALSIESPFEAAILVDEAHNIFLKQKPSFIQESVTDIIYREIREYGIGMICLDQHASKLSDTVLGNSATNIAFQQVLPADVDTISRLMFLYEKRNIFTRLRVGQAAVKLTDRFHEPFLVHVEMVRTGSQIIDDFRLRELVRQNVSFQRRLRQAQESMDAKALSEGLARAEKAFCASGVVADRQKIQEQALAALKGSKEGQLVNYRQKEVYENISGYVDRHGTIRAAKQAFASEGYQKTDIDTAFRIFSRTKTGMQITKFIDITRSHNQPIQRFNFLQQLHQVGSLSTTKFYELMGVSARRGNQLKNDLASLGLIDVCEEKTGTGMTKKLALSIAGKRLAEKTGIA